MFNASKQLESEMERQAEVVSFEYRSVETALREQLRRSIFDHAINAVYEDLFVHPHSTLTGPLKKLLSMPQPTSHSTIDHTRHAVEAALGPVLNSCVSEALRVTGTAIFALESYVSGVLLPHLNEVHTRLLNAEVKDMFEQLRLRVDFVSAVEKRELNLSSTYKDSAQREAELHKTVDNLQRQAVSRISEKQAAIEEIQRKMSLQNEEDKTELRQVVTELTEQLADVKGKLRAAEEDRLHLTQLAHCFDELCGSLNKKVLALKVFISERNIVTEELMNLEENMNRLHTTSCCRGTPLTVGGGWVVGEAPDTIAKLNLLCGTDIPPAACSLEQHKLLDGVIKAIGLRSQNTKLSERVTFLEKQLEAEAVAAFKLRLECEQEKRRIHQQAEERLRKLLDENAALRQIMTSTATAVSQVRKQKAVPSSTLSSILCDGPTAEARCKELECEVFELKRKLAVAGQVSRTPLETTSRLDLVSGRIPDVYQPQLQAAVSALSRRGPRPPSSARPSTGSSHVKF